ncbi:MAG TPA: hypothetical protein VFQ41_20965, partial [Candidatus Angelobacter sp.]|nr:hypothetical protein [Candidatus Angelobacter sp.]
GADATAQSKNPEGAGYNHAATGSSTEAFQGERLDATSQRTEHRDPSARSQLLASFRAAQDDKQERNIAGNLIELLDPCKSVLPVVRFGFLCKAAAGIEIPFPQQDLHLKSVSKDWDSVSEKN